MRQKKEVKEKTLSDVIADLNEILHALKNRRMTITLTKSFDFDNRQMKDVPVDLSEKDFINYWNNLKQILQCDRDPFLIAGSSFIVASMLHDKHVREQVKDVTHLMDKAMVLIKKGGRKGQA